MKNRLLLLLMGVFCLSNASFAQTAVWRNARNGDPIYTNGYCDQPYVVVLPDGKWLCVFTTNQNQEGAKGQHIVSTVSADQGRTWSEPVRIEEPGTESASWAMPYVTDFGRVYVFYDYNGDKIHTLGNRKNIREDIVGWYCYKYSDDQGRTWSERYRLDVPKTTADLTNDWGGKVQIMWGIGKPIRYGRGMMFAFTKIQKYMLFNSEGWFFRCENIDRERDVTKLKFTMLPEGDEGVKNPAYGPINSEHNIVPLNNGDLYCMHRTISGYPLESYSRDGGRTWTLPVPPTYVTGSPIKHPRACPRIWKCKNGKYLFWHHNNGGKTYQHRNPVWISGGVERDGKIVWGQPEILFYENDTRVGMSYPDLIEQDGKYWITETNKEAARSHLIPNDFIEALWSEFDTPEAVTDHMVCSVSGDSLRERDTIQVEGAAEVDFSRGMTIDMTVELASASANQEILRLNDRYGKSISLRTGTYGDIEVSIVDGAQVSTWTSDPGLIPPFGKQDVAVVLDNGPRIIQFVVNGKVCDGGRFRQFGWGRYKADLGRFELSNVLTRHLAAGNPEATRGYYHLAIYNRPLLNAEVVGNHALR